MQSSFSLLRCIPHYPRLWRFVILTFTSVLCVPLVQSANGVSDVYLWYYGLTMDDLDEDFVGDGHSIRTRYAYGFAPDEPLTKLNFNITQDANGITSLHWDGVAGIGYQIFSTTNLLGTKEEWLPWADAVMSSHNIPFTIPGRKDGDTATARFFRLAVRNIGAIGDQYFSLFEQALLASADSTWDRDNNNLSDVWEWLNFGRMGIDPNADPDGDGVSNREEQLDNSNPNDFYSQPQGNLTVSLALVGGDGQSGAPYSYLPEKLSVRVSDINGQPVANAPVSFARKQGEGSLDIDYYSGQSGASIMVKTNAEGIANVCYRLGSTLATQSIIEASAGAATPINFTVSTYATEGLTVSPLTSNLQVMLGESAFRQLTLGNNTTENVNWAIRYHGELVTRKVMSGNLAAVPYTWTSSDALHGPTYVWNDIASTGNRLTALDNSDDDCIAVALPFTFPFYDEIFTQVFVCTNGYVAFGEGSYEYSPYALPSPSSPLRLIAGVFRDLHLRETGAIYWQRVDDTFVIQYDNIPSYNGSVSYIFQIVLVSDGTIYLHYKEVSDVTNVVVGVQNKDASSGLNINGGNFFVDGGKTIKITREPCAYPWISASMATGTIGAGATTDVSLTVAPGGDVPTGNYLGQLEFFDLTGAATSAWVDITLQIQNAPTAEDTDGDGLPDAWELEWLGTLAWFGKDDPDGDGLSNIEEYRLNTRPNKADTDDDGLSDGDEILFGTNPLVVDTDGDGLADGLETQIGTNPLVADTDGDGMPDGWEVAHGTNPLVRNAMEDPDGDGYPNIFEYKFGSHPNDPVSRPVANYFADASMPAGDYGDYWDASGPGPHPSIGAAVCAAENDEAKWAIIEVAPGTYKGYANHNIEIGYDKQYYLIISKDGPSSTIVDGNPSSDTSDYYEEGPASRFAYVYSGHAIVGLTFINFQNGTIIDARDDTGIPTRLQNLRFENVGKGNYNGTHIAIRGRDARVQDIRFRDSRGRLILSEANYADVRNVDAQNCTGDVAFEMNGDKLLMEDVNLVDWTSTRWGAIYPRGSQVIWRRGLVKNVTIPAHYDYAVIEADNSSTQLTMENVMVSHNTGSGIAALRGPTTLTACTFWDNKNTHATRAAIHNHGYGQRIHLDHTIVWNASPVGEIATDSIASAKYTWTRQPLSGTGNSTGNPKLAHGGRVAWDSPVRNAGDLDMWLASTAGRDYEGEPIDANVAVGADQWVDEDQNNLPDAWEIEWFGELDWVSGSERFDADNDLDRLTNAEEFFYGTNPFVADTDGDGLNDYVEVKVYGSNPLVPDADTVLVDLNHDGIADGPGIAHGIDPANMDHDGDGISNEDELHLGTDPFNADTDGDEVPDNLDVYPDDRTRWALPDGDPNDTTPPVITLTAPANAVPLSTSP